MLKIYHIEMRRSERVVWLMEELGLPYELIFKRGDIMGSSATIKAAHPVGAAPVIHDGDVWLCESGAILEYIIARHGEGRLGVQVQQPEFPLYLQWMHFAEGTAMDRMLGETALKPLLEGAAPDASPLAVLYTGAALRMAELFERSLSGRTYFAGEAFTAADIMMHFPARSAARKQRPEAFPALNTWIERVESRPAYKNMLARALPDGLHPALFQVKRKDEAAAAQA